MSRLLIALALSALLIPVGASAATNGLGIEWVRGPVVALQQCFPSGYAVTVGGPATTTLIYQSFVAFPKGVVPPIGHYALALALGTVTCNTGTGTISGKAATYATFLPLPPATPLIKPPSSGSGSGSGSSNSILDKIKGMLQGLIKPPTQSQPSQATPSTGASTASGVGGVFGGTIGKVQPCDPATSFPSGTKFLVTIEGGAPGLFTYGAYSKSYICGPAIVPGKNTVGSYTPGAGCDIDLSPTNVVMIEAKGWMDANPGHGTSGCEAPTTPPKQEEKPQNACNAPRTAAEKLKAESDIRKDLKSRLNISVNRANGCAMNQTFQEYQDVHCPKDRLCGCTDVSGMQCKAYDYLERLSEVCDGQSFTISGGSEAGHETHNGGNAFDVNGLDQCIRTKFEKIDNCNYIDQVTGTTFYDENICGSKNKTGPHFHICVGGKCR